MRRRLKGERISQEWRGREGATAVSAVRLQAAGRARAALTLRNEGASCGRTAHRAVARNHRGHLIVGTPRRSPRGHKRPAFTLIEVSVGLIASSFLLLGMAGSLYVATQANRVDLGPFRNSSQAAYALDEVTRELSYATAVRSVTAGRSIEVDIPDRTGDGVADVLRYEWSGTASAPLQRVFNGGAATSVMPVLQAFNLQSTSRTVTEQAIGTITTTSGEIRWYEKSGGWFESTASLDWGAGLGTDFLPKLPQGAQTWTLTKVDVRCESSGTESGVVKARLWTADANRKPATLLSEATINEWNLDDDMNWYTVSFSPTPTFSASQRACITFQYHSGSGTVMRLEYDNFGFQPYWMLATDNGGGSWSQLTEKALFLRVHGTYTYPMGAVVDVTKTYHATLGLEAQAGSDTATRMSSSARYRNRLEAAP